MKISIFISLLIILLGCNSNTEFIESPQAIEAFNKSIKESKLWQEQLSKHLDSTAYEIDQKDMENILEKSKKYKLYSGSNCSCVKTYSITNTNEITFQDKLHEDIKFLISKSNEKVTLTISGTDTNAYYKPNNVIEFLDDKSKRIRMFNHFTKHKQKSMFIICDENENSENQAKLKLLQNRNIVSISINCLNSISKEIILTEEENKIFRCILNCNLK